MQSDWLSVIPGYLIFGDSPFTRVDPWLKDYPAIVKHPTYGSYAEEPTYRNGCEKIRVNF